MGTATEKWLFDVYISSILAVLLVPIPFFLTNCELNFTTFGVFGAFAQI